MNHSKKPESEKHKKERVVAKVTLCVGQPAKTTLIPPGASCEVSVEEAVDLRRRDFIVGGVQSQGGVLATEEAREGVENALIPNPSERLNAIVDTIDDVAPEDFGKDGKPNVRAIEKILGEDITAHERDHAWEKYQTLLEGD